MAEFTQAVAATLKAEGLYDNDPKDSGGETKYGITLEDARRAGYAGDMRDLSRDLAIEIYRTLYWKPIHGDEIPDQEIANEVFDAAVNCGLATAVRWLQRTLNALNREQMKWPDVPLDGILGPGTIAILRTALAKGEPTKRAILRYCNSFQGVNYIVLCERYPKNEEYALGWASR